MAGYLFGLDSIASLHFCIDNGVYSTKLKIPRAVWMMHHEGTFADFSSMKEGDNIYFFIDRKIYGVGSLVNINGDCKFLNYPNSNKPTNQIYSRIKRTLILDNNTESSLNNRFVCAFIPSPLFFKRGVDMDEMLTSAPSQFKILRAFWKLSFIKFSDEENQAFKNILFRRNIEVFANSTPDNTFQSNYIQFHQQISTKTLNRPEYNLSVAPFLNTINEANGSIKHEMAIEAALIYQLSVKNRQSINIFGEWDYLTHQVIASPFKPIDYMDKMDVFGYKYIPNQQPIIAKFLVVEIKKGTVEAQDVLQLMKYVDWIKEEYAYGDYQMINAFLLGFDFTVEALQKYKEYSERKFIHGVRPSKSGEWRNVKLVSYVFNTRSNLLDFDLIADGNI